jgi:deazaflavin-dependent oxidoreductase (nitroreductase family)
MNVDDLMGDPHVEHYRATKGAEGHHWRGTQILLLTTTGRTSGKPRTTPLIYQPDGERFVIVASKGGAPEHPGWYRNLTRHPEVEVQVGPDVFQATARTATGEERERLWKLMNETWPAYDEYQARTEREIPVVVIER